MEYSERIESKPTVDSIFEWAYLGTIIPAIWMNPIASQFPLIIAAIATVAAVLGIIAVGELMERQEFDRRDEAMVENILNQEFDPEAGHFVAVVGEKHVKGIGGRLQAQGYDVQGIWLNTMLNYSDS
jgi:hypothetical protein